MKPPDRAARSIHVVLANAVLTGVWTAQLSEAFPDGGAGS
jgi:hypothetical protein